MTATTPASPAPGLDRRLERHRAELTAYCGRRLGSASEAEDAVQETFLRAWRYHRHFAGRASFRTWLYRIATNVCIDLLRSPQRRARPLDVAGPDAPAATAMTPVWIVAPGEWADPGDAVASRDTVRLACRAAVAHLPPRQRAALALCEVLCWPASEAAELLGTTTASVTSALQRARATLAAADIGGGN